MSYPTARDEQAAYWLLKLQEPDVSAEEIQAALDWQADPRNRAALDRVAAFWNAWSGGDPARGAPTRARGMRRLAWGVAAACIVALFIGEGILLRPARVPADVIVREYLTPVGRVDTVLLADGTKVTLGGASSIHVRYAADIRHVQLSSGEALFEVAKDAQRPFIVDMPNGSVRALGTQFNVHRGPEAATVTVIEGTVRVSPPAWRAAAAVDLAAGRQIALNTDGALGPVLAANTTDVGGWRNGRLVFSEQSLRSVVADLNRYSQQPVLIGEPALASIRISGAVNVAQLDGWVDALGTLLDVRVIRDERGVSLMREGSQGP